MPPLLFVVGGPVLTAAGTQAAPQVGSFDARVIPTLLLIGIVTYVAYGVHFPASSWRFAQLT